MKWLKQKICKHKYEDYKLIKINYNSDTVTNTYSDNEIICKKCGKVIIKKEDFRILNQWFTDGTNE